MNYQNKTPKHKEVSARVISNVPTVEENTAVGEAVRQLIERAKDFETMNYIYVLTSAGNLVGVVSIKEIFSLPQDKPIKEFMQKEIVAVHPHTHQEKAVALAIRHNIKSVPVIDKEKKFLGIVPSDAILNILHEEHIEDTLKSGGFTDAKNLTKDLIALSGKSYFKKRLPWLLLGLVGSILTAVVIGYFESTVRELLILAAFVPAIVYIADAVGTQTQTIFIRSLALDPEINIKKYVSREISVSLALAVILGLLMALVSYIWWEPAILGVILGFSFFTTILAAAIIALFLPWFFVRINIDPAVASGPFATIIRDLASVFIYFSIASAILSI